MNKEQKMNAKNDPRVLAIRACPAVGRGTCSSIDECLEDRELVEELDAEGITDPKAAVAWAREREGIRMDRMMDCRWGEDDDPQVAIKAEWDARLNEARSNDAKER